MSDESIYMKMGAERGLQQFVNALYDEMDSLPEVKQVRDMHPEDLSYARDRLYKFLSGMFGGPALYMQEFGHPRLRRKHLHFAIGNAERDQWLLCAQKAAESVGLNAMTRDALMAELGSMANHLRNTAESQVLAGNANDD